MSLNTDMEPDGDTIEETEALIERLTTILKDTANALHSGPMKNGWWSWHDLADRAKALVKENRALRGENARLKTRINLLMEGTKRR